MLERFYPDNEAPSAYEINYKELYERGYKGIIFDIDNTLVPHGAPADGGAVGLFAGLQMLFVGDQLFTDVWGAKKAGIVTYLVKPIYPKEEIQIVLKRRLERIVLFFYHRKPHREPMPGALKNDGSG